MVFNKSVCIWQLDFRPAKKCFLNKDRKSPLFHPSRMVDKNKKMCTKHVISANNWIRRCQMSLNDKSPSLYFLWNIHTKQWSEMALQPTSERTTHTTTTTSSAITTTTTTMEKETPSLIHITTHPQTSITTTKEFLNCCMFTPN